MPRNPRDIWHGISLAWNGDSWIVVEAHTHMFCIGPIISLVGVKPTLVVPCLLFIHIGQICIVWFTLTCMRIIILLLWLHYQLILLVKVHLCIVLYIACLVLLLLYFLVIVYICVPSCCLWIAFYSSWTYVGIIHVVSQLVNTVCCSMSIRFYKLHVFGIVAIVLHLHILHYH